MKKTKKLVMSAETIRRLTTADLAMVVGGAEGSGALRTNYKCPGGDPASRNSCNDCM